MPVSKARLAINKYSSILTPLLLFCIVLASSWSLVIPGLGMGHDLNHQARIFEMATGLKEGEFPVIWSQNLAYGYGMPLFEFYAPLPYFLGAIFYLTGFSLAQSVEMVILLATVVTAIGCYLLSKSVFKDKAAALLVSVVITLAPYRAVDLFIRSAISEGWAIAIIPFVLFGVAQVVQHKKWGWLILSTSFALLILSHNITAFLSLPFIVLFSMGMIFLHHTTAQSSFKVFLRLTFSGLLALCFAAFYFIPALAEKDFTQVSTYTLSSYFDINQHFLYIRQFFEPWGEWEFGGSGWGPDDEMSFFLGYPQLIALSVTGICLLRLIIKVFKRKKLEYFELVMLLTLALTVFSLFLTLLKSQALWNALPLVEYIQFPWRLLSVTIIFGGLLSGAVYKSLPTKIAKVFFGVVIVLTLVINSNYFRSEKYEDHSRYYPDYQSFIRSQTSNNLYDYLPEGLNFFTKIGFYLYHNSSAPVPAPVTSLFPAEFIQNAEPKLIEEKTTRKVFTTVVAEPYKLTLYLANYPGWSATINGKPIDVHSNEFGLVSFMLPSGESRVEVNLQDTPVRLWTKYISLAAVAFTAFLVTKQKLVFKKY